MVFQVVSPDTGQQKSRFAEDGAGMHYLGISNWEDIKPDVSYIRQNDYCELDAAPIQ